MALLRVLLAVCFVCSFYELLSQGYEDMIQVNYPEPYYNDIMDEDQPEETTTPAPCKSTELTRWDKLFSMLENSQMKENMLLQYTDDIIKVELQALKGEMLQFVANYAGSCSSSMDNMGRRLLAMLDQKLERVKQTEAEQRAQQDAVLQQLLQESRNQAVHLAQLQSSCLNGGDLKKFPMEFKQQDVTEGGGLEKTLATMVTDIQKVRAQLDLSLRSAAQQYLPSGCEMALLFPMRSRRIFASVTPDVPMALRAFTVCLWAKVTEALNKTVLFSYGTQRNPQEIQLVLSDRAALFTVGGEVHLVVANEVVEQQKWGHFCGVWDSEQGLASLWVNGQQVASSPGVAEEHTLPDRGVMQLGQEKNGCCGSGFEPGFDAKLAFAGKMTGVNVWDRVLESEEIIQHAQWESSCSGRGNVVGWGVSEIIPHGGAQFIH